MFVVHRVLQLICFTDPCGTGNTYISCRNVVWVRSFGIIRDKINDPFSLGSWCTKGINESLTRVDSSAPLIHHDPSDLGSLILTLVIPKERTLKSVLVGTGGQAQAVSMIAA